MKKQRKFKPTKAARYLPGQVAKNILETDLLQYNKHLKKIKPLLDDHPPPMNPYNYLNSRKMHQDAQRLRKIDFENKTLLKKINVINRLGGKVDSYNPEAYRYINKWRAKNIACKQLEEKNQELYRLIRTIKSYYEHEQFKKDWEITLNKVKHICRYPVCIVTKSTLDEDLRNSQSISYLLPCKRPELRPQKIYSGLHFYGNKFVAGGVDITLIYPRNFAENALSWIKTKI